MRRVRVYVDTSVFGGVHDEQFAGPSRRFFDGAKQGRYTILLSHVTYGELQIAPDNVRQILQGIPPHAVEEVPVGAEARDLARAYVAAGALRAVMENDALHVAAATVASADVLLSWNFKHIVNFERIRKFNGVNLIKGYHQVQICSPLEMEYDDQGHQI